LRWLREQCELAGVAFFAKQAYELRGQDAPDHQVGDAHPIAFGRGSKRKGRGLIELPYIDGVQHAAFPEVR